LVWRRLAAVTAITRPAWIVSLTVSTSVIVQDALAEPAQETDTLARLPETSTVPSLAAGVIAAPSPEPLLPDPPLPPELPLPPDPLPPPEPPEPRYSSDTSPCRRS
jgi:hypothetical protein